MSLFRFFSSLEKYYAVLELKPGASTEEIKSAYRHLVKKYHPDSSTISNKILAAERFKLVHEAKNALLSNNPKLTSHIQEPEPKSPWEHNNFYSKYEEFKKSNEEKYKADHYSHQSEKKKRSSSKSETYNDD